MQSHFIKTGPFVYQIDSNLPSIDEYINSHYKHRALPIDHDEFVDFKLEMIRGPLFRSFWGQQARFVFNGGMPFKPLPVKQAPAMLEWAMNWLISSSANQFLIIHAAVLEKNGKAIIITAPSGSGKSTLCSYLAAKGWRLLSDELTLVDLDSGNIIPIARPFNLKNDSIDVASEYFPQENFTQRIHDTQKGTVSLVKPPVESVKNDEKTAVPALIVLVKYEPKEQFYMEDVNKCEAAIELVQNSFNFNVLGKKAFTSIRSLVDTCETVYVEYSNLKQCETELANRISCL